MKRRFKNVILSMTLVFALVFSTLSIPVMAGEQKHSIDITGSTGNGIFGCTLKVKTMDQLKKVKGIKVNGEDFTKVSSKSDIKSGKKYNLSETDPDIYLSPLKDNDKIEITTDTEKVTVTVKKAETYGTMHDPSSITYVPIGSAGNNEKPPVSPPSSGGNESSADLEITSSEVNHTYNQLKLKFKDADMAGKIKEVKVNGQNYAKKDADLTVAEGNGKHFYIDSANSTVKLTNINNNDKVELITDKGTTSFTAQKMGC